MYLDLTILALFVLLFSLFAKKIETLPISAAILAVGFGFLVGPMVLDIFKISRDSEGYRTLAELALALVLFTDASKTNLRTLENNIKLPSRLLLIGLPLTIVAGGIAGYYTFTGFSWIELCILATMLAPTDAALGKAVVTNPKVPSKIREALNVESGLNDGISVPVLFLLIALFEAQSVGDVSLGFGLGLFAKEIGLGLLVGVGITYFSDKLILFTSSRKWMSITWKPIVIVALAFSCFATAQLVGGSGFIACFTGGLLYGIIHKKNKNELLVAAEGIADTLSLITWFIFGSYVVAIYLFHFTWQVILYTILSLTIVRMIPVLVSLFKSGISLKEKLFIGWFGPRGLASIVFGIIILDVNFPNQKEIILTVVCTILVSVVAHGFSAGPLIKWLNKSVDQKKS